MLFPQQRPDERSQEAGRLAMASVVPVPVSSEVVVLGEPRLSEIERWNPSLGQPVHDERVEPGHPTSRRNQDDPQSDTLALGEFEQILEGGQGRLHDASGIALGSSLEVMATFPPKPLCEGRAR